jgi:nitrite reductase (NO-forming)
MTVAEGFVQHVWAIAGPAQPLGWGTVPGPVIRVGTGDTLRVHLVNAPPPGTFPKAHPAVNDYSHAIEFDGSTGAHAEQTTPLRRAEERTFEVTTDRPGVWLYHGSTEPVLQSLANGLYGMLIVEPVGGLDSVAQELFFVQGEWYLESAFPASPRLPSLAKAGAAVSAPDFVVVNGAADQYLDNPIRIETGQRVRAFVLNAGPTCRSGSRAPSSTA